MSWRQNLMEVMMPRPRNPRSLDQNPHLCSIACTLVEIKEILLLMLLTEGSDSANDVELVAQLKQAREKLAASTAELKVKSDSVTP